MLTERTLLYTSRKIRYVPSLKLKTMHKCFLNPYKRQISCYTSLHCEEYKHIYGTGKCLYRDWSHVVELLLQLENKSCQIMWKLNTSTCICNILVVCVNKAFPMAHFTCIVTSQVFIKIWMQWSIALSSAFQRGREKHSWIVFSFKVTNTFHIYFTEELLQREVNKFV